MELVLASGSKWRRSLLETAGIQCRAIAPNVDESAIVGESPADVARARALAKARAVASTIAAGSLVIGADQVVHLDGWILGKPRDPQAHLAMLRALRGRGHLLVTAVALAESGVPAGGERCFEVQTRLHMRADLGDDELSAYVACGEAAGCGGGYMVEALGSQLFAAVEGDWNNVVGLPLFPLVTELRALGWRPDFVAAAASRPPSA